MNEMNNRCKYNVFSLVVQTATKTATLNTQLVRHIENRMNFFQKKLLKSIVYFKKVRNFAAQFDERGA